MEQCLAGSIAYCKLELNPSELKLAYETDQIFQISPQIVVTLTAFFSNIRIPEYESFLQIYPLISSTHITLFLPIMRFW